MTKQIGSYIFAHVCAIQPEVDGTGTIMQFLPQSLYTKRTGLTLHAYGAGPFCRFRVPKDFRVEGVYALSLNDSVFYIGECEDLSQRYNMGYGQISPRNCYGGGQSTNCRVNTLVYEAVLAGHEVHLWFLETHSRKEVEAESIYTLNPKWNRKGLSGKTIKMFRAD